MIRVLVISFLFVSQTIQAQELDFENTDFNKADSIAKFYNKENLQNVPLLVQKLTSLLPTKIEQFRALYTWVSTNIESDYWAFEKNKKNRNQLKNDSLALYRWNQTFKEEVFNNLYKKQKTVCTGYAYLLCQMASFIDVNCKIIDGYGRHSTMNIREKSIPNHSWNAVELNNHWYLCDATWSSGSFDIDKNTFIPNYNDGYFLSNPELFLKSHYPLDTAWILIREKPSISEFLNAPVIYKDAYKFNITPIEPREMNLKVIKREYINFLLRVSDSINIDEIKLEIAIGNWKHIVKPETDHTGDGKLELKYAFEFLGKYDLHIKYKDAVIATYTVVSKRK